VGHVSIRVAARGNRFKSKWTRDAIIEAILRWIEEHGEVPRANDWDSTRMRMLAAVAEAKALVWRGRIAIWEAGDWPSSRQVKQVCGTWNGAILAAGHVPRAPGQHTKRGAETTQFLAPLGSAMNAVYEAKASDSLGPALRRVAAVALALADQLEED
jgi:hypothetical protein